MLIVILSTKHCQFLKSPGCSVTRMSAPSRMPSGVGPARRPQQFDKDYVDNSGYVAKLRCNPIAPLHWRRHYYLMRSGRTRPMEEADLFSKASLPEPSSSANPPRPAPSTKDVTTAALPLRYLLPRDLQGGIRSLRTKSLPDCLQRCSPSSNGEGESLPHQVRPPAYHWSMRSRFL